MQMIPIGSQPSVQIKRAAGIPQLNVTRLSLYFCFKEVAQTSGETPGEDEGDEQRWEMERKERQERRQREQEEARERELQELERLEQEMV